MIHYRVAAGSAASLKRFRQDEQGSILLLSVIFIFLMLMMGGLAVDIMRHEERRVQLQQTLDRSVLAAASLSQDHDPEEVVTDYFRKAGLLEYLSDINVSEGLNFRTVSADAEADTQPFFMHLMGIEDLNVAAGSTADERISNVEVSLVLDISGSMSGSRINNLRPAAQEFVETVINSSDPGKVTVSLVPYTAQVNVGPDLLSQFNVTQLHSSSYCIELPDSVFSTTALSQTTSFIHNGHFDPFNSGSASLFNCPYHTANRIIPLSDSTARLQSAIGSMVVGGNTSIDLGVKWGALLLDPASQGIVQGLIQRGVVDDAYDDRPLSPSTIDTLKVMVVMTDGQNTAEYKLNNGWRTGNSIVWLRESNGEVWAYHNRRDTNEDYYNASTGRWATAPHSSAVRLTWPQVFARWTTDTVARYFYAAPLGGSVSSHESNMLSYVSSTKNSRMQTVCTAAKNAGIVIYGIAFEAPSDGQTQIRNCATSDAHYFNANGLEISTVFRAIASQISYLRLTQ